MWLACTKVNLYLIIRLIDVDCMDFLHQNCRKYIGQRNYHWEAEEIVYYTYSEGTVTLDLVDLKNDELIWQAVSKGALDKKREKNNKKIAKAIKKLFKKFPKQVE